MSCRVAVNVYNAEGALQIAGMDDFISLDYTRSENEVGAFEIVLPGYYIDYGFDADWIFEFYREVDTGQYILDGETCWFLRKIELANEENVCDRIVISGHDTMGLLKRRIVAWPATEGPEEGFSDPGYKTAEADDAILQIYTENFGNDALGPPPPPAAVSSPSILSPGYPSYDENNRIMAASPIGQFAVDTEASLAPVIVQSVAWRVALEAMRAIADESAQRGTRIIFDIIYEPAVGEVLGNFSFQIWVGERGSKRTGILFSPEYGNMANATFTRDFTDECTWAFVGGADQGAARITASVIDPVASNRSPFYPIECFVDQGQDETNDEAALVGRAIVELRKKKPLLTLSGDIIQTEGYTLGVDYFYGDTIRAAYGEYEFDARVSRYQVHVEGSTCEISIPFTSEI